MTVKDFQNERWFAGKGRPVVRTVAAGSVGGLELVDVEYADGPPERYLVVPPDLAWARLLRALPARLELLGRAPLEGDGERVPSVDQSNTLVVVGERLLIKAYRNLRAGLHPEVEVLRALEGTGAPVPRYFGELRLDGTTTVALLQQYVAGAVSGWEEPIEAVAAHLRGAAAAPIEMYALAGAAAAALHRALRDALDTVVDPRAPARRHAAALALLEMVDGAQRDDVKRALAPLATPTGEPLQRIHGDLHVAQLLFAGDQVLVIDFEGDPTAPLEARRAPDTPLRDLATLLRSIDHVGTAAARRAGGADPSAWIAAARAAALAAYGPVDPIVLHALEVAAELRELNYARRVLPEWAYVAHAGLARLLEEQP
jgi:maltokinase